jgi:hypothetical protein
MAHFCSPSNELNCFVTVLINVGAGVTSNEVRQKFSLGIIVKVRCWIYSEQKKTKTCLLIQITICLHVWKVKNHICISQ